MARPKCTEPISSYLETAVKCRRLKLARPKCTEPMETAVKCRRPKLASPKCTETISSYLVNGSKVQEAQIGQPQVHRARLAEVVPEGKSSGAPICYQKEDNNLFGSYSSRHHNHAGSMCGSLWHPCPLCIMTHVKHMHLCLLHVWGIMASMSPLYHETCQA